MEFRTRIVCIAMTLGVVAACNGGEAVAPDAPDVPLIPVAEGDVNWFCWIDDGTGEIHSCEFWCAEEDAWLQYDANGDLICDGFSDPIADGPGDPGPGGGGTLETDTATITLSCDKGLTRGDTGGCTLSYPSWTPISNIRWQSVIPDVSPNQWGGDSYRGEIVIDTPVEVTYDLAGQPAQTRMDVVTVASRSWDWDAANLTHSRDMASAPASWNTEPDWDAPYRIGRLCSAVASGCETTANPFIYPDFRTGAGYTIKDVEGGPNDGLWYVSATDLGIWTKSWINDGFRTEWEKRALPSGSQADGCRTAMGLGPSATVWVNFNTFNGQCMGKDMVSLIRAMLDHEEDHHDMVTAAAGQTQNIAPAIIESTVRNSELELRSAVQEELERVDLILQNAGDATEPRGNWSSTVWIWKNSLMQYIESGTWTL